MSIRLAICSVLALFTTACSLSSRPSPDELFTPLEDHEVAPDQAEACPAGTRVVRRDRASGTEVFCATRGGTLHGSYSLLSPQGQVLESRHYVDGLLNGRSVAWRPDGSKASEQFWLDGVAHGATAEWRPDGSLRLRGQYLDGLPHGRFIEHTDDGGFRGTCYRQGEALWTTDDPAWIADEPCPPTQSALVGVAIGAGADAAAG